ncbi:MAG: sensor histidine kinase [Actinomycetota bacterium]
MSTRQQATECHQTTESSVADDAIELSVADTVAGAVRVVCDIRLACVLSGVFVEAARVTPRWWVLVMLSAALPLSYVPLRHWDRWGERIGASALLLIADAVFALSMLAVQNFSDPMAGYAGATVLLVTIIAGSWPGFLVLVMLFAGYAIGLSIGQLTVSAACVDVTLSASAGYAGVVIRRLLVDRAVLRARLDAARVQAAHAAERARLAREMHDSVAKTVHGVRLLAVVLHRLLANERHAGSSQAKEIIDAAEIAQRDTRDLIADLREFPVRDLSVVATEIAERVRQFGVQPTITVTENFPHFSEVVVRELAKCMAEAADNVLQHSGASRLHISMTLPAGMIEVRLADDGVGLPSMLNLSALQRAGHYGLVGMRERMTEVGGVASWVSHGQGTVVILQVPRVIDLRDSTSAGKSSVLSAASVGKSWGERLRRV